ncbi:MAG: hypothetical protein QOI19_19 [Thermoleophilaceae bacterium]|nr:hypothetical protein [Thermoleophilaceae bacterium]
MPLRAALLLALCAALLAPAAASADITVSNVQAKPAQTNAGANSDFALKFNLGGSESIRDLDVNLPAGLIGNPNNAGKCTQDQFNSDSCPAASKVGTQTVNITLLGLITADSSGEVFNLVPDKPEPAQLGIRLDTPAGTQHLKSDVTVRPSDSGLTSSIRGIPNTVSGAPIHINSISLTLLAKSGTGQAFMRNPTSCGPAVTTLHAVGDVNSTADGQGSFTPTACDALPYAPKLTATVGAAGQTAQGANPPLTTIITQAPGEADTKATKVTLGQPLAPNPASLANVCHVADYNADNCPAQSQVGTATAVTPLLAAPLTGPVRSVENPGGLPHVVVYLNGLINVRLVGDVTLGPAGTTTTFSGIPDTPLSSFELDFAGGSGGLLSNSADLCTSAPNISGEFSSHSGKTVAATTAAAVQGCPTPTPAPTPKPKWPTASASLSKLATSSPTLQFSAKRGVGAKRLSSIAISLPGPLSFDRGYLSPGVKASKSLKVSLSGKRTLLLRSKSPAGVTSITALVSKRALRVSDALRRRVAKHPTVYLTVRFTELGGRVLTRHLSVTVR